jgi:dihydrodipicolinate synthase/N-acetylneuraminate lyase
MNLTNENFRGSWAGLPVAWTPKDEFDEQVYRGDVARVCRLGAPGVYTGGTTGEFYAMEFDEFKRVTRTTVEGAHQAGKPAMIGVTSTYTLGAARRAAYAAEIGADAIQLALPFWMEVPDSQVIGFFREVSVAAGHCPFSIYDVRRAKKILTFEQHRAIKSELPNYLMVKSNEETLGITEEGCAGLTRLGINVFADEGSLWPTLGPRGVAGCCSSFIYYAPGLVLKANAALEQRRWAELKTCCDKLKQILDFVVQRFVSRGHWDTAMDRLGGVAGGVLRTSLYSRGPYPHANQEDVGVLREWYREHLPEVYAQLESNLRLP